MANGLHWLQDELPDTPSWYWALTTQPGSGGDDLPIERYKSQIIDGFRDGLKAVAINAPTASGKTLKAVEYCYEFVRERDRHWWRGKRGRPYKPCICLVQESIFACEQVVESLGKFGWSRNTLQLKSSRHDETFHQDSFYVIIFATQQFDLGFKFL